MLQVRESKLILSHRDLIVYQRAMELAREVFEMSKLFPKEETYSLTDQIRRSSRSVAANIAEAWRKRRYEAAFASKLSDSEAEAAESQTWLESAFDCGYISSEQFRQLFERYEALIRTIVGMQIYSESWTTGLTKPPKKR